MWKFDILNGKSRPAIGTVTIKPKFDAFLSDKSAIYRMYVKFDLPENYSDLTFALNQITSFKMGEHELFNMNNLIVWINNTIPPYKREMFDKMVAGGYLWIPELPVELCLTNNDFMEYHLTSTSVIKITFARLKNTETPINFHMIYETYTDDLLPLDHNLYGMNQINSYQLEYKMYIAVNTSLNMGKGKIGAQVGHGVAAVTEKCLVSDPALWTRYKFGGQTKICVKATQEEMEQLAQIKNACVIHDAGRTQIAPNSLTVVAFMPCNKVHASIAALKLL